MIQKENLDSYSDNELELIIKDLETVSGGIIKLQLMHTFSADSIYKSYKILGWLALHVESIYFDSSQHKSSRWKITLASTNGAAKIIKYYLNGNDYTITIARPALVLINCGFSIGKNNPEETFKRVLSILEAANTRDSYIDAYKSGYYGIDITRQVATFSLTMDSQITTNISLVDWLKQHTKSIRFVMPEHLVPYFLEKYGHIIKAQDYKVVPPTLTSGGYPMKISYSSILTVDTLEGAPKELFNYLKPGTKQIHNIEFTFGLLRQIGYRFWE